MGDFNAETDEDNGCAKPAGHVVAYLGGLIGLLIPALIFWFLVGRHGTKGGNTSSTSEEHATTFALNTKGMATPTATNYVYRVVGPPGSTATIRYVRQDTSTGNVKHAVLPWSIATATSASPGVMAGGGQPPYVSIRFNASGAMGPVTCQVIADGTLFDQETANVGATTLTWGFRISPNAIHPKGCTNGEGYLSESLRGWFGGASKNRTYDLVIISDAL